MPQAAVQRVGVASEMLAGEQGAGRLREVAGQLLARRARMINSLTAALGLGFNTGARHCVGGPGRAPHSRVPPFPLRLTNAGCWAISNVASGK